MRQKLTKTQKNNFDPYLNGKKIKLHFVHEQDICITAVHVCSRGTNTLLALHRCTVIPFMESSIRRNLFFILYSVKRGNPILYFSYSLVRMTVTQYTTTLHLSFPVNNELGKALKTNETQHVTF